MIGLFTFDGPIYYDINGIYCSTTITNQMLRRYLTVVDKLYVAIRTFHINDTYQSAHLQKVSDKQIEIIELPNLNTPKNFIFNSQARKILETYVARCDLFFLRIPSIISNITATLCRKAHKPYFVEVGGCAWDSYFHHGILGKLVAPVMFNSQRRTVRNATFATYVTQQWLQQRYPTSAIQEIASNVYLQSFDESVLCSRIGKVSQSGYQPLKLGTIASVDVRYKGQDLIIRAMGRLKREGYNFEYYLVGAGDPAYLFSLATKCGVKEHVHHLGVKLHEDVFEWLDQIDIYAQPSRQEGLPRSVIEAMNRACICIGSDTAGIPELLDADFIFKSGNVSQLCRVLRNVCNINDYKTVVRRNFKKSEEFSLEKLDNVRNGIYRKYRIYVLKQHGDSNDSER